MATTQIPLDPRQATGVLVAPVNADATGHAIPMLAGRTYMVRVNNGAASPITLDIDDPASGAGVGNPEYNDVTVTNGTSRVFAFKRALFGKVPTADIALTFSSATTITVEAYGPLD